MKYWPAKGKAGFIVWRYLLRRDDPTPPPWTKEGKKRIEEGGWGELRVPENYEEVQAEKLKKKAAALEDKDKTGKSRGKKRNCQEELETESKIAKTVPVAKFKIPSEILEAMDQDKGNRSLGGSVDHLVTVQAEKLKKKAAAPRTRRLPCPALTPSARPASREPSR